MKDTTHFGYQEVPINEKTYRVREVFNRVARRYDLMNDLMSLGLHRLWKRVAIETLAIRPGMRILDLAAGTGDLARAMARRTGSDGSIFLADINDQMLRAGRDSAIDAGQLSGLHWCQCDAEALPFPTHYFDRVTIGFGLRNVTKKEDALGEIFRVLKPGGQALILEFSKPTSHSLTQAYNLYSFSVLPLLGKVVAGDMDSYQYLAESIRKHPDQNTLKAMMETAGFESVRYQNLTGGIVAIHNGTRP
ncbi:bifunctional demethylmenaquinone methyltransferase/2-methoxy-6-polyprenyl-1,4-benzoquinol methylase UbiE [Litorivicinus sp.]|nr:bifunctional demethylmenaquinone methyltransferase/2-methoxy-6-polyprenyl-1,4-benzoquinol methylase UbiE [Litorivicinus sp.]